jgi:hypothetical protein
MIEKPDTKGKLQDTYFDVDFSDFSYCRLSYSCSFSMPRRKICDPDTCKGDTDSIKTCRETISKLIEKGMLIKKDKGDWKLNAEKSN